MSKLRETLFYICYDNLFTTRRNHGNFGIHFFPRPGETRGNRKEWMLFLVVAIAATSAFNLAPPSYKLLLD